MTSRSPPRPASPRWKNSPLAITLTGSDVENSPLTFSVLAQPANGALTGTPPNLTYTPASGFHGSDSFTFRANDGTANSATATISITITKKPPVPGTNVIPRTGWSLKYVDSQETFDAPGTHAFDGNPATFWHTQWRTGNLAPPPHEIQINLGATHSISGFQYLPRQDSLTIGNAADYEFYVSTDGTNWGNPVASGTFANSKSEKQVIFSAKSGRFVRFRVLSEVSGFPDTCVAELNVLAGTLANQAPVANPQTLTVEENSPLPITLGGSDPEGSPLTYTLDSNPASNSLARIV